MKKILSILLFSSLLLSMTACGTEESGTAPLQGEETAAEDKNMSSSSGKKVRFISDTQILEDPTILNGVRKIHVGELSDVVIMSSELGKLLASSSIIIVDDVNAQPNFIDEFGSPLAEEVQVALRAKLKDS